MQTYKTVSEYIKKVETVKQPALKAVRALVQKTIPKAEEGIAYGMPGYKFQGKPLFYFAAMKGHLGIYPTSGPMVTCKALLKDFSTSKGCVRVPYESKLPTKVIVALLKARVQEIKHESKRS